MAGKKKKSEFKQDWKRPKAMKVFGSKERKKLAKFYKDAPAKPVKLAKKRTKKGLARKVLGKLGPYGKAAVGASIAYDVAKSIPRGKAKPLAKGQKCKKGESVVRVGGKTYCMGKPKKR
jgi:hypothetical protein